MRIPKARACQRVGFLLAALLMATQARAQESVDGRLDLIPVPSTNLDFNGFPINPRWRIQTTEQHPQVVPSRLCLDEVGDASCTSQKPRKDEAPEQQKLCPSSPKGPRGHVNWFPVTYSGQVYWKGWQVPPFLDDDFDLALSRKATDGSLDDGGLTQANQGLLALEFNAREVVDNFVSPWWVAFRKAASRWWNKDAAKILNDREAIVIGLAGLDCVHECHTELHPVYGLAINTKTVASSDHWAVFLQNWGIEGCCCRSQHYLDVKRLVIPLHGRAEKKLSGLGPGTRLRGNQKNLKATLFSPDDGGDLYLSVDLTSPDERPRVHGEIELLWDTKGSPRRPIPQRKARAAKEVVPDDSQYELWPPELPDAVGFARLKEYVAGLSVSESPGVVEEMDLLTLDQIRAFPKRWRNVMVRTKARTGDSVDVPITVVRGKKPTAAAKVPDRPVVDEKWFCREMPLSKLLEEKAE